MLLPLVESVTNSYQGPYLNNVLILGVQHVLETTHSMFKSLYKLGLRPENISILGKCYSSCKEVYNEMLSDGIDVDIDSFTYSSHTSFDSAFENILKKFILNRISKIQNQKFEKIIILDDGGKCIELIQTHVNSFAPIIAIEQTSSGYEFIKSVILSFPVINVAKSSTKLRLESPMIANAAYERINSSLLKANYAPNKALIIGAGAIGLALKNKLMENSIQTHVYDIKTSDNHTEDLIDLIQKHEFILGCTGKTSLPHQFHHLLKPGTVLVSASSSDREFDAVYLRKKVPETNNCHTDQKIDDLLLIRNGFPVNFDGERENIDPHLIQLTIALMTAGILQACSEDLIMTKGVIPLNPLACAQIEEEFIYSCSSMY